MFKSVIIMAFLAIGTQGVQIKSDPICSSAGCVHRENRLGYPIDYKVPNFGEEHHITESKASLDYAEK